LAEAKSNGGASYVAGVEWMKLPETAQNSPLMDEFHPADDLMKDPVELRQQNYDVLLCLDILEHLTNPWQTLQTWSKHLIPGGKLLISLPNIREISVLWKIAIRGDFAYSADGILDRTHLRFFARRNAAALPDSSQYQDIRVARRFPHPSMVCYGNTQRPSPLEFPPWLNPASE
jgi:SAM-dependent methyltransferase